MYTKQNSNYLHMLSYQDPAAVARISGSNAYPDLTGSVRFFHAFPGVVIVAEIFGLPNAPDNCADNIYALHIHDGEACSGTEADPFANAGMHYNPKDCPHPAHAGDLPPLFAFRGFAWEACYTERFRIQEVIGKTVIVHSGLDDFTTQPSGNAGAKIGCGIISQV